MDVIASDLYAMRSGVVPEDVKIANRENHKRMLDMQILGLMVSDALSIGRNDRPRLRVVG